MYRCQLCQTVLPAGTPEGHVVVERRAKSYPSRELHRPRSSRRAGRLFVKRSSQAFDRGGEGWEIVREITVCPEMAQHCSEDSTLLPQEVAGCPFRGGRSAQ
ncbi:MAG: hypothetical protein ACK5Q5_11895 [Planctomycetaceae bacterium]